MVTKCIIQFCNTIKSGDGVTLHKLPADAEIQKEWFRAILNETGQTIFSEDDVICSKHFSPSAFTEVDGHLVLSPTAVPFEPNSEGPVPKRIKREEDTEKTIQCSVFSCQNNLATTEISRPDVLYHPFPKKPEIVKQWKIFCNREEDDFKCSHVCSDHFVEADYNQKRTRVKILKADAVPTIYKKEILTEEEFENSEDPAESKELKMDRPTNLNNSSSDKRLCVVINCPSSNEAVNTDLYPFPESEKIRIKWLKRIEGHTTQINLLENAVICSLHFKKDCFKIENNKKQTLLANAVPSIFSTPKLQNGDFFVMKPEEFDNPQRGKEFYEWSMRNYQEQRDMIKSLKDQAKLQSKRIARLAKSVDDFKSKRFVSEDANNALQKLFDKIIDTQYDVL